MHRVSHRQSLHGAQDKQRHESKQKSDNYSQANSFFITVGNAYSTKQRMKKSTAADGELFCNWFF